MCDKVSEFNRTLWKGRVKKAKKKTTILKIYLLLQFQANFLSLTLNFNKQW